MNEIQEKYQRIIESGFVVLDTETTGLDDMDQVVEVGMIDERGNVLFDERIKPTVCINSSASDVHGIYHDDLEQKQEFKYHYESIMNMLCSSKYVMIYNSDFDIRMLAQSATAHEIDTRAIYNLETVCVMNDYCSFGGYQRWQRLTNAAAQQRIAVTGAHSAVGDCQMTLQLIKKMAGE